MKPIDEKISAFVKRCLPDASTEETQAAGDRVFQRLMFAAKRSEEAAEPPEPVEQIERLSAFDYLALTAVHLLRGEGWSVAITNKMVEMSGKKVNPGSVFVALDRLEDTGLLETRFDDHIPEGRKHPRRLYAVTDAGVRALAHARETAESSPDFLRGLT